MNPPTVTPCAPEPAWDEKNCPMQLALVGAEADPEPTNTPAAIKATAKAENRACRMTTPFEVGRSSRFANRFVNPS
jgi:hypothetical protein